MGVGRTKGILTSTSKDQLRLFELVFNPSAHPASKELLRKAFDIRVFFVNELGWSYADLIQHRFLDLHEFAKPGELVVSRMSGLRNHARDLGKEGLRQQLRQIEKATSLGRKKIMGEVKNRQQEVEKIYEPRRVMMTHEDWKLFDRLRKDLLGQEETRGNRAAIDMGEAMIELLRGVYL